MEMKIDNLCVIRAPHVRNLYISMKLFLPLMLFAESEQTYSLLVENRARVVVKYPQASNTLNDYT